MAMAHAVVTVAEVKAFKTQSGNTRFVLRDDEGREYTTFREEIARQALAAEGQRARVERLEASEADVETLLGSREKPVVALLAPPVTS